MKQNRLLYWIAGIAAIVGGGYIAMRAFAKGGDNKAVLPPASPQTPSPAAPIQAETPVVPENKDFATQMFEATVRGAKKAVQNILSRYMKYRVATRETALNIRQKPDGASKIVGKLQRGDVVYARSTDVMGWMQVSKDGKNSLGYVSSSFLQWEAN